jgi:hypothetical protein
MRSDTDFEFIASICQASLILCCRSFALFFLSTGVSGMDTIALGVEESRLQEQATGRRRFAGIEGAIDSISNICAGKDGMYSFSGNVNSMRIGHDSTNTLGGKLSAGLGLVAQSERALSERLFSTKPSFLKLKIVHRIRPFKST